jgi:hypothetical protein
MRNINTGFNVKVKWLDSEIRFSYLERIEAYGWVTPAYYPVSYRLFTVLDSSGSYIGFRALVF